MVAERGCHEAVARYLIWSLAPVESVLKRSFKHIFEPGDEKYNKMTKRLGYKELLASQESRVEYMEGGTSSLENCYKIRGRKSFEKFIKGQH